MKVIAKLNYLRISPRKVRLVSNLIKGMEVEEAERNLTFLSKRVAKPLLKLLKQAIANAKNNFNLDKENLFIFNILVNQGPSLKRWRARARGIASPIIKRSSHIALILEEKEGVKRKAKPRKAKTTTHKPPSKRVKQRVKPKRKLEKPPKEEKVLKKRIIGIPQKIFRRKSIS